MQTIYLDVLLVVNIYVNFFLLRITAGLTHSPLRTGRCIAVSAYASLYSLLILAPEMSVIVSALIRFASSVTIIAAAFGFRSRKRLALNTLAFYTANFILAGSIYAVSAHISPDIVHFSNNCFYINISLFVLILTTAGLYAAVYFSRIFLDKAHYGTDCYRVLIRYKDKLTELSGLADTGNSLVDMFTGSPVIVCDRGSFPDILPDRTEQLPRGFRLIPCRTVSDTGVIPVFRPDEVLIINSDSGSRKPVDALIGLGKSSGTAIFNPELLKF